MRALHAVLHQDMTLDHALDRHLQSLGRQDRAFAQYLVYAVLRRLNSLQAIANALLQKPLARKYADLELLLLLGLQQLQDSRVADHAAISATVNVCDELHKNWARGLINAVLRRFQREQAELLRRTQSPPHLRYSVPEWLLQILQQDWPNRWRGILQQALRPPPMWLRANLARTTRNAYLVLLADHNIAAASGNGRADICLREPLDVEALPGFAEGLVSIQDSGPQLATEALDVRPGQRVLDLCAAPGGKACLLLEQHRDIRLEAVDIQPRRLQQVRDNLHRLGLKSHCRQADATKFEQWWDGQPYDRILLDAPCSATGVIRRHPDIKWRLHPDKLLATADLQRRLLDAGWTMLARGGRLLYVTCSVLHSENEAQMAAFMQRHAGAGPAPVELPIGQPLQHGWQILPGDGNADGIYCLAIEKPAAAGADATGSRSLHTNAAI